MRNRKDVWTALGIAGLAALLLCGRVQTQEPSNPPEAQRAGEPPTQPSLESNPGAAPSASAQSQTTGGDAALRRDVARLRQEVAQLRAELAEVRDSLAAQQGVGGAGQAGTGGAGTAGTAPPPEEVTGTAVATAIYSGTVQEVEPRALVLADEEGSLLTLEVDSNTRVLRNGRRIPLGQLQPGTRVRATVDLLTGGRNEAVEVLVQPAE